MNFKDILETMIEHEASDCFIKAGAPLKGRICLEVETLKERRFSEKDVEKIVSEMISDSQKEILKKNKSFDFATNYDERWRFRIAIFYQRNALSVVIRKIDLHVLRFQDLNLPSPTLERFCNERQGIILLTGITGSGKSTAIASMMKYMNQNLGRHILTVEEPIEFTFDDEKSVINQRELASDVDSYPDALKQFTLHSPDVIYIGNIRDQHTCQAALTAAETGVLVLSTIHTVDAGTTIERIVNFFPPQHHNLIYTQLSVLLKGVMSLRLLPRADEDGLIPAYEIMTLSPSVSSLIRESKIWELPKYIASGDVHGMKSFNQCLFELVESKRVSGKTAIEYSNNKEDLQVQLRKRELI